MGTNTILPAAIKIYKGLSIYRVNGSMNWYVRIWDSKKKKYLVKSTGCDNAVQAQSEQINAYQNLTHHQVGLTANAPWNVPAI